MNNTRSTAGSSLERIAFTIPEFCFRNSISRPTYHRLRSEGRGPVEMRPGLNIIRITAEAERNWQRLMQEPREDLETRAIERAVKAGEAAARSDKHISKKQRGEVCTSSQNAAPPRRHHHESEPAPRVVSHRSRE